MGRRLSALVLVTALTGAGACSAEHRSGSGPEAPTAMPTQAATKTATATVPRTGSASPATPAVLDAAAAYADVRSLAGRIGPRLATGPAFREAGQLVTRRFREHGYHVRRQTFRVPSGDSWGVPVDAGHSFNVVATPRGFDPGAAHLIVGAHLDTVAVAPGAEDNASGVAVLLELARMAAAEQTRLPTVFVTFGAEEPRGLGDDMHHFGSQHYVREMSNAQRKALRAMVAVDRAGVGSRVPVCTGPLSPPGTRNALLAVARRQRIPAGPCELTTSDHWSFEP